MDKEAKERKFTPEEATVEAHDLVKKWIVVDGALSDCKPDQIKELEDDIAHNLANGLKVTVGQEVIARLPSISSRIGFCDLGVTVYKIEKDKIAVELPPGYEGTFRSFSPETGVNKKGPDYGWIAMVL
jgi:hypothetical protein